MELAGNPLTEAFLTQMSRSTDLRLAAICRRRSLKDLFGALTTECEVKGSNLLMFANYSDSSCAFLRLKLLASPRRRDRCRFGTSLPNGPHWERESGIRALSLYSAMIGRRKEFKGGKGNEKCQGNLPWVATCRGMQLQV
jgi:hypothetical protein